MPQYAVGLQIKALNAADGILAFARLQALLQISLYWQQNAFDRTGLAGSCLMQMDIMKATPLNCPVFGTKTWISAVRL
jgi:hypothetical protein